MKVIRTFVAVLLAEDVRQKIAEVQAQVKKLAPDVKWVAPDNFHVTLRFLGPVPEDRVVRVGDAVADAVQSAVPFEIALAGVGAFPSPARARVVWVGIQTGVDELSKLASAVDLRLAELGFERDDRPFKAHVTIGRVKVSRFLRELAAGIAEAEASCLGLQRVCQVAVMESDLRPEGAVYSPLRVIELSGA